MGLMKLSTQLWPWFLPDDPEYIMYVTVQEPKTWDNNFYATVVNPVLEEAMSMGDTLDTSVSEGSEKTEETELSNWRYYR